MKDSHEFIIKDTIRSLPLFSELSIEQLRLVSSLSKIKKFAKNEILFRQDDVYQGFYIVLKGTIKIFRTTSKGKESVIHIFKPINVFGDIPLFEGKNYPVSAQSLDESIVMFVSKKGFLELLKENPDITLKMLAGFAKRLKSLVTQVEDLTSREIQGRLAKYILKEIKFAGKEKLPEPFVKLSVSKSTLAAYLGTITETLSRTFKKLQNEGIIRMNSNKIFVTDMKRLKDLAE